MKSNYKNIGRYVKQVNKRNKDLSILNLKGINIDKYFMPSVANTQGTDLSKYKIVSKNQFAFNPMHVGRDEVLPISMLEPDEPVIVSPAYIVFEIEEPERELLPEYLMMWCRRSEFDRNAWFTTDSSVRGGFSWSDFCNLELPVPSIEKQREIVKEYNTVVDRIKLNEDLNKKLEETAQTIYKYWFVDFEFPISKEYAEKIGKPELEGKPYKSSDGEMIYNEDLDREIPEGWKDIKLGDILQQKGYIRGPFGSALKKEDMVECGIPVYEQQHAIYNHRKFRYFISEDKYALLKRFTVKPKDLIISCSGTMGKISVIKDDDLLGVINQALLIFRINDNIFNRFIFKYFLLSQEGQKQIIQNASGSVQVNMAKREIIEAIPIPKPSSEINLTLGENLKVIDLVIENSRRENESLQILQNILLSKMTKIGK